MVKEEKMIKCENCNCKSEETRTRNGIIESKHVNLARNIEMAKSNIKTFNILNYEPSAPKKCEKTGLLVTIYWMRQELIPMKPEMRTNYG